MLPDRVSNPGPLTYESGALPWYDMCFLELDNHYLHLLSFVCLARCQSKQDFALAHGRPGLSDLLLFRRFLSVVF